MNDPITPSLTNDTQDLSRRHTKDPIAFAHFMASIIESSDDAIVSKSLDGIIQSWNPGAQRLFGFSPSQAIGCHISIIIPDERASEEVHILHQIRAGKRIEHYETVRKRNDGVLIDVSITVSPIRNERGDIIGVSKIARDITGGKQAQLELHRSEERYRALTEASATVVWRTTSSGGVVFATNAWCEITGQSETEKEGWGWLNAIHPDDRERTIQLWTESLQSRTTHKNQFRVRTRQGEYRWFNVRGVPVLNADGTVREWIGANTDFHDRKMAEDQLRENGDFIRGVLNSLPAHVAVLDENGIVSMVNEPWNQFAAENDGNLQDLTVGANYFKVCEKAITSGDGHTKVALDGLKEVLNGTRKEFVVEYPCHSNNHQRWFLMHARRNLIGQQGLILSHINITERKEAELEIQRSEERLRSAAEAAGFGMIYADLVTGTVNYSKELRQLVGIPDDADKHFRAGEIPDWVHPDDRESLRQFHEQLLQRPDDTSDFIDHRIVRVDGKDRWVRLKAKPVVTGDGEDRKVTQVIATLMDITQQRQFEQSLKVALELAEAANQAKSAFLANMSHEIRTPMTAIIGYTDLVAQNLPTGENSQYLQTIKRNGEFLLEIINDILDLSKIEAGKLEPCRERFAAVLIVEDVRSIMDVRAKENNIELSVDYLGLLPAFIESDPKLLKQVLINLVGNAIKFTQQGSVKVIVSHSRDILQIEIVDTGIGMSDEQQKKLFEPFAQGDASVSRKFGGTGLGLAISSRLAKSLGGTIVVKSQIGLGSSFTLTISTGSIDGVALVEPITQLRKPSPDDAQQQIALNCHVLIVDDRREIRFLSSHFLREAGATTSEAEDGEQAVVKVSESISNATPFSLVLLDMQMPRLDGYSTAVQLRKLGYAGPIIAITADAMQGDMNRCIECGCNDYLSKPIDKQKMLKMVRHYVQHSQRQNS